MAARKTAQEYKDLYLEEKFKTINGKLDDLLEIVGTKASCSHVDKMDTRLKTVEQNHTNCPITVVKTEVDKLKTDRDVLMDITEDARFYKKRPTQFKILVIGFIALIILNILAALPSIINWRTRGAELEKIKTEIVEELKNK